ncbi:orotidine-5'-phosphate decarboxylase [Atractiella rhizophila]|nr:orotidine-5'-phosphate decarboxylase [Atractiella rhizophila]
MPSSGMKTYGQRAEIHSTSVGKELLKLMERKSSNLCVSVDVTLSSEFLRIVEEVGPYCCMIKTHIDIIEDFTPDLIQHLLEQKKKHDFLIFEDRKFADIGNTVKLQYSSGIYKIASWADITNAHGVPGEGIVKGLASIGMPLNRGLLLLAEMSSAGTLAKGDYSAEVVEMARRNKDFVMGFIAMGKTEGLEPSGEDWIVMTPGVGLDQKGDGMGQQYRSPQEVMEGGSDVAIVGRGIYSSPSRIAHEAKRYRDACWNAYKERMK